jgi:iron complex outermembrane receptor protein
MTVELLITPSKYLQLAIVLAMPMYCGNVFAEDNTEDPVKLKDYVVEETIEDNAGIMPSAGTAGASVFGLDKPLVETPRSVTEVSAELMRNYGLRDVGDLVRMTPGAMTGASWGVPGSLDLRGEPSDNYYRGFKRIENRNNYATPIRAASSVDIVKGPVSPMFGPGKVGGYMNFTPKSARSTTSKYIDKASGEAGVTVGSYDQYVLFSEGGSPFTLGGRPGGVYGYIEQEDSKSYYDHVEPKSTLAQLAFDMDLSDDWRTEFGGQYLKAKRPQNAGWNRVTQDLVDHGTYITGSPANLNTRGDVLYPDNVRTGIATGAGAGKGTALLDKSCSSYGSCSGFSPTNTTLSALTNPGTTQLDHNQTLTSKKDIGQTETFTGYFDLIRDLGDGWELKNQAFFDQMNHLKYSDNGFTGNYHAYTWEDRLSLSFPIQVGEVHAANVIGVNYRYYSAVNKKAQDDQVLDRRDLSVGATPNDSFDIGHAGIVNQGARQYLRNYNVANNSVSKEIGAFVMTDLSWNNWDLLLGYRLDNFDVRSADKARATDGRLVGDANGDGKPDWFGDRSNTDSYNVSLSYKTPWGFVPYVTHAVSGSLQTNQIGDVAVADIKSGAYLQDSTLDEYGIKYSSPSGNVYAALAYFDQDRSYNDSLNDSTILVNSKGFEGELRWLMTQRFSMSLAASKLKVEEKGKPFTVLNGAAVAEAYGLDPSQVYGYRFINANGSMLGGEWDRGGVPEWVTSLYGNYNQPWGIGDVSASLGFTWADATWADNLKTVRLPAYTVWNGSLGYGTKDWSALLAVNNLLNEKYFTSADTFDSVLVFPSQPRTLSATFTHKF